jgi:hypothetical protein
MKGRIIIKFSNIAAKDIVHQKILIDSLKESPISESRSMRSKDPSASVVAKRLFVIFAAGDLRAGRRMNLAEQKHAKKQTIKSKSSTAMGFYQRSIFYRKLNPFLLLC